jgi:hypothetical protein
MPISHCYLCLPKSPKKLPAGCGRTCRLSAGGLGFDLIFFLPFFSQRERRYDGPTAVGTAISTQTMSLMLGAAFPASRQPRRGERVMTPPIGGMSSSMPHADYHIDFSLANKSGLSKIIRFGI